MKKIYIHQPDFAPSILYFYKIYISDFFIILDDVQFIRRGWTHRDRIRNKWITVPIIKGDFYQKINSVKLNKNSEQVQKFFKMIENEFSGTEYFNNYFKIIKNYFEESNKLMEFNLKIINLLMSIFNLRSKIYFSSDYDIQSNGSKKLVEIINKFSCSNYITGEGSKNYIDLDLFKKNKIRINWINNEMVEKKLNLPQNYTPKETVLGIIFNHGTNSEKIFNFK